MILADLFESPSLPLLPKQLPRIRGSYGAFIITVSVDDFLALTTTDAHELKHITDRPFPYDKDEYVDRLGREEGFGRYDMPFLKVQFPSGKIFGHEGRHRAAWVKRSGGTRIPVTIYPYSESEYTGQIEYYDDNGERQFSTVGPFGDHTDAVAATKAERHRIAVDLDLYVSRDRVEHTGNITLKGQPDRSDGWDKAAWRVEDFPEQLVGQYNRSVVVRDFRVGLVKGYNHFRR